MVDLIAGPPRFRLVASEVRAAAGVRRTGVLDPESIHRAQRGREVSESGERNASIVCNRKRSWVSRKVELLDGCLRLRERELSDR